MNWVEHSIEGPVATITLGAPKGPSRINVESAREWSGVLDQIEADDSVSVIVIKADGPVWSVGGDLPEFRTRGDQAHDYILEIGEWINKVVTALDGSSKLTIASVHGAAAGGGLGPMLACDFVIAAEDTSFTLGYSKLATNPDAGVSWFLPRIVGYRKALELYLTSERLSARQAQDLGMVNRVVAADDLESETGEWAARLGQLPNHAVASTKRLFKASESSDLAAHADDEISSFAGNTLNPEFTEGVNAFVERREPRFVSARKAS